MSLIFLLSVGALIYLKKNKDKVENYKKYRNIAIGALILSLAMADGEEVEEDVTKQEAEVVEATEESESGEHTEVDKEEETIKEDDNKEEVEKEKDTEKEEQPTESKKEKEEVKEKKKEKKNTPEKRDRDYYNKSQLTYYDLARNPDKHILQPVSYTGKVLQVISLKSEKQIRLAVNDDLQQTVYVAIPNEQLDQNILENDRVRVYGTFMGEYEYTTVLGAKKSVPLIVTEFIDFK